MACVGMECRLMCVMRRVIAAQVYSVVRWLFGCGLVGLLVVLIVLLFLSFLATPGLCCFLRVTPQQRTAGARSNRITMNVQSTTAAPAAAQCRSPEQVQRTTAAPVAAQHRKTNEVQSVLAALECAR